MKVLWLCNTLIPEIALKRGMGKSKPESWISAIYKQLYDVNGIKIVYLYPSINVHKEYQEVNFTFISYPQRNHTAFEKEQVKYFQNILKQYTPDIIHIFGTESPHSNAMLLACEKENCLDKAVLNIQGLVSICAKHYFGFLPEKEIYKYTFRDLLKHQNLFWQKKGFENSGYYEIESIKLAKHVIGRTDWDKACVTRLNNDIKYHFCNEILRSSFYEKTWDITNCELHSIFVSQCQYPLKGFHIMLEAMADIIKWYPDAHLYTTGKNPLKLSLKDKLRQTYYNKYLGKIIKKYHLENHVTFLGYLSEEQMCERFIKSNVFVCCSTIENSPNSVGEAMILGVPTISSDIGGVKNQLIHEKDGFIYQADAPYMAAYYIKKIFDDDLLAQKLSKAGIEHANLTYNVKTNVHTMLQIYSDIMSNIKYN